MPVLAKLRARGMTARDAARDSILLGGDSFRESPPAIAHTPSAERMCGAPGCAGKAAVRWALPWKSRQRPIFEQEWGCGTRCIHALVEAAVRRETAEPERWDGEAPHRHRVPLGLVLLAQGWITHPQLQSALESQRASGRGRIGDWLTSSCGLGEERIARGLGVQWSCPVLSTEGFSPAAMAPVLPKRFIAEFGLLPMRVAGSRLLYLAFEERMDAATALGVEQMSGLKVESGLLPGSQFHAARAALLAAEAVPVRMQAVADRDALTRGIASALQELQPLASRLVRVHQYYWLRMWLESAAMAGTSSIPPGTEDMRDVLFVAGPASAGAKRRDTPHPAGFH
jgi:hypothetical protein